MKLIILPQKHRIIEYFNFLDNENKSFEDFKKEFNNIYIQIKKDLEIFNNINSIDHINYRYPLSTPYFIKNEIKNKKLVHIGCRKQELDVGFTKYANKVIGIELEKVNLIKELKNIDNYELIINNYKNIINNIEADIYYFWCGYMNDINILNDLICNYKKKGIFYIGVPQQDDKLCIFLDSLKKWYEKNKYVSIDYVPLLFDESHINTKNPTQFIIDNNLKEWNNWKTFNNMKGILFLMKITV